jgi:hypothetical protein
VQPFGLCLFIELVWLCEFLLDVELVGDGPSALGLFFKEEVSR